MLKIVKKQFYLKVLELGWILNLKLENIANFEVLKVIKGND